MSPFSRVLRRLRQEAGHLSARSFYKAGGGPARFGCSYKQYLNIENGASVPGPGVLRKLTSNLHLETDEVNCRIFAEAYLRSVLGGEEDLASLFIGALSGGASAGGGGGETLLRKAVSRGFSSRQYPLSSAQTEFILRNPVTFWVFTLLSNDRCPWGPRELAKAARQPLPQVRRALSEAVRLKLMKRDQRGRYLCPLAGRILIFAEERRGRPHGIRDLDAHFKEVSAAHGQLLFQRSLVTRAEASDMSQYMSTLADALRTADVHSTQSKGGNTAFYLVEGAIRKILPF